MAPRRALSPAFVTAPAVNPTITHRHASPLPTLSPTLPLLPCRYQLAEAQVARLSDFGRNDTVFYARTHLGHLLHPGERRGGEGLSAAGVRIFRAVRAEVLLIG